MKITGMNPEELEPRESSEPPRQPGLLERVESADQEPGSEQPTGRTAIPELRERAYYNQPVWKRVVVIAAGPVMNILVVLLILFALAFTVERAVGRGEIDQVQDDSPAAGKFQPGDRIVSVDGIPASNLEFEERIARFRDLVDNHKCAGEQADGCTATTPVQLVVDRGGEHARSSSPRIQRRCKAELARCRLRPRPGRVRRLLGARGRQLRRRPHLVHHQGNRLDDRPDFPPGAASSSPARWMAPGAERGDRLRLARRPARARSDKSLTRDHQLLSPSFPSTAATSSGAGERWRRALLFRVIESACLRVPARAGVIRNSG